MLRFFLLLALLLAAIPTAALADENELAAITSKGRYYEVQLTVPDGDRAHRRLGEAYGEELSKIPDYEKTIDSYLNFVVNLAHMPGTTFKLLKKRAHDIKPQLPPDCLDEITGIASRLKGTKNPKSRPGDGLISEDEFLILNLLPDIARPTQCSAVACFGQSASDATTHLGRNLDWNPGDQDQILNLHAVIHFNDHGAKLVSIGFLGCQGIISGINDKGLYAAILDSPTGARYTSKGKRSYYMDLRNALAKSSTAADIAMAMKVQAKNYTFNHLILCADDKTAHVLETNFSGFRFNQTKHFTPEVRYSDSKLHKGMSWKFKDCIGTVNSFLLAGHFDNHNLNLTHDVIDTGSVTFRDEGGNPHNVKRWKSLNAQLEKVLAGGHKLDAQDMKSVISYFGGKTPGTAEHGDLLNYRTVQCMIYTPQSRALKVYFHKTGDGSSIVFDDVPVF